MIRQQSGEVGMHARQRDHVSCRKSAARAVAVDLHGPAIILATRGAVRVSDHAGTDGAVELRPGDAVYVGGGAQRARFEGRGEAFVAQPGRR